MRFKVTSEGNNSTFGDLFFSLPTEKELDIAAQQITELCRLVVPDNEIYKNRLEEEILMLKESRAAYHFLLMKEICDLSPGGIMLHGNTAGSLISKCLFLLSVDVLDPTLVESNLSTPVEFIWGLPGKARLPVLDACIAPEIRPDIHKQLDRRYGRVETDDDLFRQITLTDRNGIIRSQTVPQCTDECRLAALYMEARGTAEHTKELLSEGAIDEIQCENMLSLTDEMQGMTSCDLPTFVRLYAYLRGNFEGKRQISNFQNPWFFTTREEFYAMLLGLGMPKAEALDTVKYGVWSSGKKRERYVALLEEHSAPEALLDAFSKTDNLWSAASILSRINFLLQTI